MKPKREHATKNAQTYFVTSETWQRRSVFCAEPWARLFCKTLLSYRGQAYLLHEFVLLPDHFHLLITPLTSLERAMQFIKGGFSYRAKLEFGSNLEIWQRGFSDHRIRNAEDYESHVHYIHENPVKRALCGSPGEYPCSSAYPGWRLDPVPQGLKPLVVAGSDGTAEAVPLQNITAAPSQISVAVSPQSSNTDAVLRRGRVPQRAESLRLHSTDSVPEGSASGLARTSREKP